MSYQLRRHQSLGANLRRICRKQIEGAIQTTRGEVDSDDTPAHQTRKHLKRARAALRLVSGQLRRGSYKQQDRCLRDIGRLISEVRDAEVRLQTVRQLQEITRRNSHQTFRRTEGLLQSELEHFLAAFAGWQSQAVPQLEKLHADIEKWPDLDCKNVRCAVQRAYKSARDALVVAREQPTPENFHAFRSEAKRLYYELRILRPINPLVSSTLIDELDALAQVLGRAHDLHFLGERLRHDHAPAAAREARELVAVAETSELDLQKRGLDLAERFFDERPRDFGHHLGLWLEQWLKSESPSVADALLCDADVLG